MLSYSRTISDAIAVFLITGLICGCGSHDKSRPKLGTVKGKVVYKGNPVVGAGVTFMAEGASRAGMGATNEKGEFQLTTFDANDGAIVGTHKITVVQQDTASKPMSPGDLAASGGPPEPKESSIPSKYADIKTTPLTKSVVAGKNDFTLELTD